VKEILIVGDIILDRYTVVNIERFAQEADIPVFDMTKECELRLGGAANVAVNAASLGVNEVSVSISGISDSSINEAIRKHGIDVHMTISGCELEKHRLVTKDREIVARMDSKKEFSLYDTTNFEDAFLDTPLDDYDLIIISDYNKGTVTEKVARYIIESGVRTIVDSKRYDLSIFDGAFALNINKEEYSRQVSNKAYVPFERLFDYALVTLGEDGSMLRQYENAEAGVTTSYIIHSEEFPTKEVEAVDVTGCGDTHTAAFAVGLARDSNDVRGAVRYANGCATIAVQKFGTSKVSKWDFSKSLEQE
jgi:D-beta-D-heptose 7-phosphate kinase/D-beta-D-heptose 1-phosphate adenosyltransferase